MSHLEWPRGQSAIQHDAAQLGGRAAAMVCCLTPLSLMEGQTFGIHIR